MEQPSSRHRLRSWHKKRIFLDEGCGEDDLKTCFPTNAHVYVAADFGVCGKEDTRVIDDASKRGCLIVTVNKDFVAYYRENTRRKGKNATYFHGLIFLNPSKIKPRREQLQTALREIAWGETGIMTT